VWWKNVAIWTVSSLVPNSSAMFAVTFKPVTVGKVNALGATWSPAPVQNYSNNAGVVPITIMS
jgi:hypothetical protein